MDKLKLMKEFKAYFDKNLKLETLPYQLIRDWNLNAITYQQARADLKAFENLIANFLLNYEEN